MRSWRHRFLDTGLSLPHIYSISSVQPRYFKVTTTVNKRRIVSNLQMCENGDI